jgi:hypothetical protein
MTFISRNRNELRVYPRKVEGDFADAQEACGATAMYRAVSRRQYSGVARTGGCGSAAGAG